MRKAEVWAFWGHEPSYHLKRMHSKPSLFTLGEWADEWQKRLRSEECIKKAAEDGINIIYTSFFKGFGLEFEKEEIEETKKLVEIAHKYNIKVLGYCQLDSIYYETFLAEDPDAKKMAVKKRDGSAQIWEDSYYRWPTCYNSKEFIAYIKKVIDYGIDYVGVDGFHFDNSYIWECFCENCKKDFREYLKRTVENPKEILGINTFDYIEIPYFEELRPTNHDTLWFLWQKYRQQKCADVLNELFGYAKEKSGGKALVLHNPSFPRASKEYTRNGFNPELNGKYCDYILAENRDNLMEKDGKITTQVMAYKFGERFGYKVFESSWRMEELRKNGSLEFDSATYPKTYFQIAYYLSQSMILGKVIGSVWLMRSTHRGGELLQDDPLQRETHRKVISYFKRNHQLYEGRPVNQVKVLYSADNLIGMTATGVDVLKDVVNRIHNSNIQFSFLTKDEILHQDENQIIVVPEVYFADDELNENLEKAAEKGCRILVLGQYYVCNIYGKAKDERLKFAQRPNFIRMGLEDDWISELRSCLQRYITVSCPYIVSEVTEDEAGKVCIHLLSTKERGAVDFEIELHGWGDAKQMDVFSFEDVTCQQEGNVIKIKNFQTMATIIL